MGRVVCGLIAVWLVGVCASIAGAAPTYTLAVKPPAIHEVDGPINPPGDVAIASELIAKGREAGPSIVYADIVKTNDGRNRDLLDASLPAWSRPANKFHRFADSGIQLMINGWSTQVGHSLDEWIRATGEVIDPKRGTRSGNVGYWNYTVVAELRDYTPTLPPMASIPLPGAFGTGLLTIGVAGFGWYALRGSWRRGK